MTRPWPIWLVFAVCSGLLLGVMGWVSHTTLQLDRLQADGARTAEFEERARLALWRMDSWVASLILEESARPFSDYEAFAAAARAYTKSQTQLKEGEVLVPSPLLVFASSNVLLHFQYHPDGRLTSPQVPLNEWRQLAEDRYVLAEQIDEAAGRLAEVNRILREPVAAWTLAYTATGPAQTGALGDNADLMMRETERPFELSQARGQVPDLSQQAGTQVVELALRDIEQQNPQLLDQRYRNDLEFNSRANTVLQAQERLTLNNWKQMEASAQPSNDNAGEGVFKALWLGEALVLARRVNTGPDVVIQGAWLNWTNLQSALAASVSDLFSRVRLEPMARPDADAGGRLLASLPVELFVEDGGTRSIGPAWTPLRLSLVLAWVCVLGAGLAVGLLLRGIVGLSERRAAFVSAVTHELRTPLTTFKMYSEMLADDMVPGEARRRHYLGTLCSEANRLSHLVENVLAYARLERGSARKREERIAIRDLVERVKPRLVERATQAGMALADDVDESAGLTVVQVDVAAVEQILFNLVDNACKYGATAAGEKVIHIEALPENGRQAMLRVRDHGQGISAEAARRLFKPFSKSASEAAQSAPGVGLGLALCRRLSRGMGGNLHWDARVKDGAGFVLLLPVATS